MLIIVCSQLRPIELDYELAWFERGLLCMFAPETDKQPAKHRQRE